jgi:hypothetical protein
MFARYFDGIERCYWDSGKTERVGTESKVVATCPEAVAKIREPVLHINKIREYLQEAADFQ